MHKSILFYFFFFFSSIIGFSSLILGSVSDLLYPLSYAGLLNNKKNPKHA